MVRMNYFMTDLLHKTSRIQRMNSFTRMSVVISTTELVKKLVQCHVINTKIKGRNIYV